MRSGRRVAVLISVLLVASSTWAASPTLGQRIEKLFGDRIVSRSESGILIVDVESGAVVAQHDPDRPLIPASNMKLFTTSAGLELLGPGYEFRTAVSTRGDVDRKGVLHGDIKITGGGDPTIGVRLHDGDPTAVFNDWASAIEQKGIRTIAGNLIFEYGFFDDEWVHPTWPVDQLTHWYEAPVSALALNEGCVTVRVRPGHPGGRAIVELEPANHFVEIENSCVTRSRGRGAVVMRALGTNTIIVTGNIRPRQGPIEVRVTVQDPVKYFASVARDVFEKAGITVKGTTLIVPKDDRPGWKELTYHATPLSVVTLVINKKSQNHYAEQLMKTIGAETSGRGSWASGTAAVRKWLIDRVGVPPDEYQQVDGSGMSREDHASARVFVKLLRYMWAGPHRRDLISSLPYSGETESRLRRRMSRKPYARNVYAKTGYLVGAVGLSGYVRGESGKVYAFSMLFNNYRASPGAVYQFQDKILEALVKHG